MVEHGTGGNIDCDKERPRNTHNALNGTPVRQSFAVHKKANIGNVSEYR